MRRWPRGLETVLSHCSCPPNLFQRGGSQAFSTTLTRRRGHYFTPPKQKKDPVSSSGVVSRDDFFAAFTGKPLKKEQAEAPATWDSAARKTGPPTGARGPTKPVNRARDLERDDFLASLTGQTGQGPKRVFNTSTLKLPESKKQTTSSRAAKKAASWTKKGKPDSKVLSTDSFLAKFHNTTVKTSAGGGPQQKDQSRPQGRNKR